jgi:hypothetical protein
MAVLLLYHAPNLALMAYKGGFPIADADLLGVEIRVANGWYPVASSDSLLGKALLPTAGPPLVVFQRPSLIWPWRGELFAVKSYRSVVDKSSVQQVKQAAWGQAMLLRPNPGDDPDQRLFAVPSHGVGIVVNDQKILDDIVVLRKIERTASLN